MQNAKGILTTVRYTCTKIQKVIQLVEAETIVAIAVDSRRKYLFIII